MDVKDIRIAAPIPIDLIQFGNGILRPRMAYSISKNLSAIIQHETAFGTGIEAVSKDRLFFKKVRVDNIGDHIHLGKILLAHQAPLWLLIALRHIDQLSSILKTSGRATRIDSCAVSSSSAA